MTHDDLLNRFTYHPPREGQAEKYNWIRGAALSLAQEINRLGPVCREKYLAITKLEESVMWANAAIARHGEEAGQRGGAEAARQPHKLEIEGSSPSPATTADLADMMAELAQHLIALALGASRNTLRDREECRGPSVPSR